MKRTILSILSISLIASCGEKSTNDSTPPSGISVVVAPGRVDLDLGESQRFTAYVYGTSNRNVRWLVQDIIGGNSEYGVISDSGLYTAPASDPDIDSVRVTAVSLADTTKSDNAWAVVIDPNKIYVAESGSDSSGTGSRQNPYRTITYALSQVQSSMQIIIGPGQYTLGTGEAFPLVVRPGVTLTGAGRDSTYVIGPGGGHDLQGAVFSLDADAATIERMNISTADHNGIGVLLLPGILVKIKENHIGPNYTGISAAGDSLRRPLIESNIITGDSIGISTAGSCELILRGNEITYCGSIGLDILDTSRPDLGTNDSTDAGGNTIRDNGGPSNHWLIKNESPDTIMAVGNSWVFPIPADNDQFIYDDDESGDVSGPVILENQ